MPKKKYTKAYKKIKKKKDDIESIAIPAGLFVGMGIGFLTGSLVGWLFIGLGAGFLLLMILKLMKKK